MVNTTSSQNTLLHWKTFVCHNPHYLKNITLELLPKDPPS